MNTETLQFHKVLESVVAKKQFGQLTINVVVQNGVPVLKTLNIVAQKRRKYELKKSNT